MRITDQQESAAPPGTRHEGPEWRRHEGLDLVTTRLTTVEMGLALFHQNQGCCCNCASPMRSVYNHAPVRKWYTIGLASVYRPIHSFRTSCFFNSMATPPLLEIRFHCPYHSFRLQRYFSYQYWIDSSPTPFHSTHSTHRGMRQRPFGAAELPGLLSASRPEDSTAS